MKRFAPLALIVLALAAVPAAFADNSPAPAPAAPSAPAASGTQQAGHPFARIQFELLRIRLQIVELRYQIACHDASSDRCAKFKQNVVDRLTKLDQNVQDRIAKNCSSTTSTDKRCDVLTKLDQKLQDIISKVGSGAAPVPSSGSNDQSGLDNAAGSLAGSNTKP
jgi:hypothetical protein